MMRGKFKLNENLELVPVEEKKKEIDAPAFIPDEIPGGIKSMVTGKIHTSKSALRHEYRVLGYEEVGNDEQRSVSKAGQEEIRAREVEEATAKAFYEVRDGEARLNEYDKARCEIINRNRREYNYDEREFDEHGNPRE